jgi:hypothetical protein
MIPTYEKKKLILKDYVMVSRWFRQGDHRLVNRQREVASILEKKFREKIISCAKSTKFDVFSKRADATI